MCKKPAYLICVFLIVSMGFSARAAVFTDTFDAARDYLVDGVAGTGWDGFLGQDAGETVATLNASTDRAGQLFLQSTGSYWEAPFSPRGPFLYKLVQGDFVATVEVTDFPGMAGSASPRTEHADAFLMARVADLNEAGAGEDFVCIHYFPTWVGNMRRQMDNGTETEGPSTGDGFNCARFIQLERVGNVFTFRRSFDGVTWTTVGDNVTRADMGGLTLQVGLAHSMYNSTTGYVAFDNFSLSGPSVVPPGTAYNAEPANRASDVPAEVVLRWTPAEGAVAHDLYFGMDPDDLAALATGQTDASYDAGRLAFGQTYFWRVDEVKADGGVEEGDLWSFTVEPYAYPIAGVVATASSQNNADMGPGKVVDGSGLNDEDQHGVDAKTMWLSAKTGPQPTWIQFEFDQVYKLDHMLVWNSNQAMEVILGLGSKDITIESSADGAAWTALGEAQLAQASGNLLTPETVDLGGVMARYIRLTIHSNWGGLLKQYSLSEVRFFHVPVAAREPQPASGATGVDPQVTLSWRAGREAAAHEVSLSTDEQAVIDGTATTVTVDEPQYAASVDLGRSYFWKITEVNEAADPTAWAGDVWTFTTAEYLVVDDFENYTDDMDTGGAVFQTWSDGWEVPANGSVVGYGQAPFAERTTIHSGRQSMPLAYENTGTATYSEAKRTFESPQDWTRHGVTTLALFFHGATANAPAPLYVKINDTKVVYSAGAAATALPLWKQWNIDLAATGANLKSVRSLAVGVEGSGAGMLFVDDIRLYREAPTVVVPADPGPGGIVANYLMDGNVQDSSGRNLHGTVGGDAGYEDALPGHGQALIFNGTNAYVTLPIGSVVNSLGDMTISMYVNFPNTGGGWQRILDFGSSETVYMFLSPRTGTTGPMRFAIRTAAVGEQIVDAPATLPSGWHHVAVVIDSAMMTMRLHLDGAVVGSGATTLLPKDLGNTTQNWLGRSQFAADAYFTGSLDEFRIYNRALSEAEVRYLAGDR